MSETRPLVAVLGGGQLGWMLGLAGAPLGLDFRFLDPSPVATARSVGELVVGALDDEPALLATAAGAEVVTYEWEGVPAASVEMLVARGHALEPSTRALEVAQDRLSEKQTFEALGIGLPPYRAVDTRVDLHAAVDEIGLPAVLKTRRGGYDGKGQYVLREPTDLDTAWTELGPAGALILEQLVSFDRELSVIAVRGRDGDIRTWPLTQNEHVGGILRVSRAPAPQTTSAVQATALAYARSLLEHFEYVGVLALELFQVGDALLANELAPRVHNSGHWTIEGATTSQFENHLRAILGRPLGDTSAIGVNAMVNCIGALPDPAAVDAIEGAHLHAYGKTPRPGRKVGHVTLTAVSSEMLRVRIAQTQQLLAPGSR
jgi:5-(carboxyamino)imidazole ribonucleotide synthase